jgi:hypothetical protein
VKDLEDKSTVTLLDETSTTLWIRKGVDVFVGTSELVGSSYVPQRVAGPLSGMERMYMHPCPSDTNAVLEEINAEDGYSG